LSAKRGDCTDIGTGRAGFVRAVAKSEAERFVLAETDQIIGRGAAECGKLVLHVTPADLTALWQVGLSETQADQSSGDDKGLHGCERMRLRVTRRKGCEE